MRNLGASVVSEAPPPPGLLRKLRPNPDEAWLPSRSRKLLPRFVTAAPAERSELIAVGVGLGLGAGVGVGVGVGVGEAVGVGVGVVAAWTGGEPATTASMSVKATATALAKPRPVPVCPAREGRDEPHINCFSKKARQLGNCAKSRQPEPICPQFRGSVNRSWSSAKGDCRTLLFRCHRRPGSVSAPARFREPPPTLANPQISCCNIGYNRI